MERENNGDGFPHAGTRKLDAFTGRVHEAFISFNERQEPHTRVSDAQHGNNRVGFNSINLLPLSLYHINTCQLTRMR